MADDSDDKTEDPTQKRLDDAVQRGDVAKSQEVNTWFMIAGATLVLSSFSGSIGSISMPLRNLIANSWMIQVDGPGLLELGQRTPKFSKISPASGAKRVFGKQALLNFVKGLLKLVVLGSVMGMILWKDRFRLQSMIQFDPQMMLSTILALVKNLLGTVVAMLAAVAIVDYFFQYRQWFERQKMSLQEIKDEFKQAEGDPHVKGRIRQLRNAKAKKRMMSAVPKASVVITNPTHYAVALSYERGMKAPICVAKGVDLIALKIREIATAHDIPIVENVPLARALHASVEIDDEIPVEHYHAVAEVVGYVMGLKRGFSGRRQ
jgi:flagellar biosynthesis protein FlhB